MNATIGVAIALSCSALLLSCEETDDTRAGAGPTASGTGGSSSGTGGSAGGTSTGSTSTGPGGSAAGGGGGGQTVGTEGCGEPLADGTEQWVAKTVNVDGTDRDYFVYLPASYDPDRPYPVVYQFHGCSSNVDKQNNNPPVQDQSGGGAIHIRGRAVDNCWDTAADGTGVAFFDAVVPVVEAAW
ncbi:MAG: hypothetical protein JRI68_27785, partial [Deltaproteobacteria bacterium]|nr:hypothetical protein [Deltaproteobacteria bacterium]